MISFSSLIKHISTGFLVLFSNMAPKRNRKQLEYKEMSDEESEKDFSADEDENYKEEDVSSDTSCDQKDSKKVLKKDSKKVLKKVSKKVPKKDSTKQVGDNQLPVLPENKPPPPTPTSKREIYLGILKNELYISDPPGSVTSLIYEKGIKCVYFTDSKAVCPGWYCCSICAWLEKRQPGGSTGNALAHLSKHDKDDYKLSRVELANLIFKATMLGTAMSPTKIKKMLPPANDFDANFLDALIPNAVKTAGIELLPDVSSMATWSEDQLKKSALKAIRQNPKTQQTQSAKSQEQETSEQEPPNTTISTQQAEVKELVTKQKKKSRIPKANVNSREPEQHDDKTLTSFETLEKLKHQLEQKSTFLATKPMTKPHRLALEAEIKSLKDKVAASESSCSVLVLRLKVPSESRGKEPMFWMTQRNLIGDIIHDHSKLIDKEVESDKKLLLCDVSAMKIIHKENFYRQHQSFIDSLIKDLNGDFTDEKVKSLRTKFNLYMPRK